LQSQRYPQELIVLKVRECGDIGECRRIWELLWPGNCIFDLWAVRDCFARAFNRPVKFMVAEEGGKIQGALALSWIEEEGLFAQFPGETWQGKTWLEQNKIPAANPLVFSELLASLSGRTHLRYLIPESIAWDNQSVELDETGYLFFPGQYGYSFQDFRQQFSAKSRKNYAKELSRLEACGISFRYDDLSDLDHIFRMNIEAFKDRSYFSDPRFLNAFENLTAWLHDNGLLRTTAVIIGGEIAAVDIGSVLGRHYTVLAGGTNPDFAGVAKLINFHHIEWSCAQRLEVLDFLCGDFGWKERFHLTPRPLYQITASHAECVISESIHTGRSINCEV